MRTNVIRKIGLSLLIGTFTFGMTVYANPNEETYAKVTTERVILTEAPNSESINIKELQKDDIIRTGDPIDDYTEVILENDKIVYIESQYIESVEKEQPEIAKPKADKGQDVINFALKYVGNPYRYGGNSLTNGTDCSGFTSQVYKNFGVNIERTSGGQYSGSGTSIQKSELQPGDLVFYGYDGKVNHVAIYMGDNKIVHAGTAKTGIHVSPLQQRGMAPYIGAKRVI
ncbi:MAG TPA: C40 family peptidase [Epulopiscium sp.]|nr:C40 family peptidase [Candidatus Epulonipiscium sp.]